MSRIQGLARSGSQEFRPRVGSRNKLGQEVRRSGRVKSEQEPEDLAKQVEIMLSSICQSLTVPAHELIWGKWRGS